MVYQQQLCGVSPITVHLAGSWRADSPSVCPERGAHTAGHKQSVTGGHRCPSFTLQPQQHDASNLVTLHQTWQPVSRRQGLPLTASNGGVPRGEHAHTIFDDCVVLHLISIEFEGFCEEKNNNAAVTTWSSDLVWETVAQYSAILYKIILYLKPLYLCEVKIEIHMNANHLWLQNLNENNSNCANDTVN